MAKRVAPITADLNVAVYYCREGDAWIMDCPALRMTVQGDTLAHGINCFRDVLVANIELWHQAGELQEVLQHARSHRRTALERNARHKTVKVPVPLDWLIAEEDRPLSSLPAVVRQSVREFRAGKGRVFDNVEDAMKWLES